MLLENISSFEISDLTIMAQALVLCACRVLTFVLASPFFNARAMNRSIRAGLVLTIASVMSPIAYAEFDQEQMAVVPYVALVAKELLLGLVLGGLVWLPVRALEFAGTLLDTQRGSTMGQDFNALFNAPQTSYTTILLSQIFSGLFFTTGGMLLILNVVIQSATLWPPTEGWPSLNGDVYLIFSKFAGAIVLSALVFILPISGFMLLADIGIAFIAKSAPTLNAMTFGMPVKSGIMLIMLYFYVAIGFPRIMEGFGESTNLILKVLEDVR